MSWRGAGEGGGGIVKNARTTPTGGDYAMMRRLKWLDLGRSARSGRAICDLQIANGILAECSCRTLF